MKLGLFTDIHWGAKTNSPVHNNDNLDFIFWLADKARAEKWDMIAFLGDWFENRNAINVSTLNKAYRGMDILNDLGIPIKFLVGNHDLFFRGNREEFSTYHYSKLQNVHIISESTFEDEFAYFPYLFSREYPDAAASIIEHKPKYVFGHFEFRNFIVTGTDRRMDHGPDHTQFSSPQFVFSGHFHKRQAHDNIIYIGNTFPTNYGDAWDDERGCAVLDTDKDTVEFYDWEDCPKYRKVKLSAIIDGTITEFPAKCRVKCIIDVPISYSDTQALKEDMMSAFSLREFLIEENADAQKDAISTDGSDPEDDLDDTTGLDDAVVKLISTGFTTANGIEANKLIEIYNQLPKSK